MFNSGMADRLAGRDLISCDSAPRIRVVAVDVFLVNRDCAFLRVVAGGRRGRDCVFEWSEHVHGDGLVGVRG